MAEISLSDLNEQLKVYIREKREVERLTFRQQELESQILEQEALLITLEERLQKELRDLKGLEQKGPRKFIATALGQREQWVELEYELVKSAQQKRDACYTRLSDARRELADIDQQLKHLGAVGLHYEELISLKEKLLLDQAMGPYVAHILKLENLRQDQLEIARVAQFTEKLLRLLDLMRKKMKKALRQEMRGKFRLHRAIIDVLEDWKTLFKGLLHLERRLNSLLAEVEIKLPHSPSFYPKLFDHFIESQFKYQAPSTLQRILSSRHMIAYWHRRALQAYHGLDAYHEELTRCFNKLEYQNLVLQKRLEIGEVERQRLLEQL